MWVLGVAAITLYVAWLAALCGEQLPQALVPVLLYVWPIATIGWLAFFQKLLFGAPTKRLRAETVRRLNWRDWRSFPYLLRLALHIPGIRGRVRLIRPLLGFVPTAAAMALPIICWTLGGHAPRWHEFIPRTHYYQLLGLLAVFMSYAMAFAFSELAGHWRNVLKIVGLSSGG